VVIRPARGYAGTRDQVVVFFATDGEEGDERGGTATRFA
jgi:hypothetical protein